MIFSNFNVFNFRIWQAAPEDTDEVIETNVQGYIPRRMLRKEKTLTETNVLNLRWIFTRPAMDANVKVL